MSNKFVKNTDTINFSTALVIWRKGDGSEAPRPALVRGGTQSRTGLTRTPTWKEEGAFPILREREYLSAIMEGKKVGFWYFTGHGARDYEIRCATPELLRPALLAWQEFRQTGCTLPQQATEESKKARNFTLNFKSYTHLTPYEAEEMLPRFSEWASMEVEEEEDGTTYIHTSMGTARRNNDWECYIFTPQGHVCEWEGEDGWHYKNTYRCTDSTTQRWYLERCKVENGQYFHEWEITEDERNWTTIQSHVDLF